MSVNKARRRVQDFESQRRAASLIEKECKYKCGERKAMSNCTHILDVILSSVCC